MKMRLTAYAKDLFIKCKWHILLICFSAMVIILSGWSAPIGERTFFPTAEAVDIEMIYSFGNLVNPHDLQGFLGGNREAEQIIAGMQANLSSGIYKTVMPVKMEDESVGTKIVRILLNKLFQ